MKPLFEKFQKNIEKYDVSVIYLSEESKPEKLKNDTNLEELKQLILSQKDSIIANCSEIRSLKEVYRRKVSKELDLDELFPTDNCAELSSETESLDRETISDETKKFIIIGDNAPIAYDEIINNEKTAEVFSDIFSLKSESNIGTFEIPADNEKIFIYQDKNAQGFFKSMSVDIKEGAIEDIRVVLLSKDKKTEYYFENTSSFSLLHSTKYSGLNKLRMTHKKTTGTSGTKSYIYEKEFYVNKDNKCILKNKLNLRENEIEIKRDSIELCTRVLLKNNKKPYIILADILDYHPNAGNNYVPNDKTFIWPFDKLKETTTKRREYVVLDDTSLQTNLDLRVYSDLLGLAGDEPNGIFQIEGKANFHLNPFNIGNTNSYIFRQFTPFIRYSRIDDDKNYISATDIDSKVEFKNSSLELIQKSSLRIGANVDLYTSTLRKEKPLDFSIYAPIVENITPVKISDSTNVNFQTLSYGAGVRLDLRKFNNIGLVINFETLINRPIGNYDKYELLKPKSFLTTSFSAETFYFPDKKKNQSIFVRFRLINDVSRNRDSFFQLQIGYKFTLGVTKLSSK